MIALMDSASGRGRIESETFDAVTAQPGVGDTVGARLGTDAIGEQAYTHTTVCALEVILITAGPATC